MRTLLILCIAVIPIFAGEHTEFQAKKVEPFHYCAVEMIGSYMQHEQGFTKLYESAGAQGLNVEGSVPLGIYLDNPMDVAEDLLEWQVGFKIDKDSNVQEPLVMKKWDVTKQVETIYTGSMNEEMGTVQGELFSWIMENGYQPSGPVMMEFIDPGSEQDGQWIGKVKIIIPISE